MEAQGMEQASGGYRLSDFIQDVKSFPSWFEQAMGSPAPGLEVGAGLLEMLSKLGSVVPAVGTSPMRVVGHTPQGILNIEETLKSFHPAARKAIEQVGLRKPKSTKELSSLSKYQPMQDIQHFENTTVQAALEDAQRAGIKIPLVATARASSTRGMSIRPDVKNPSEVPFNLIEEGLPVTRTPTHEFTHWLTTRLSQETRDLLSRSFLARRDLIEHDFINRMDSAGLEAFKRLKSANQFVRDRGMEEILARLLEGGSLPSGPEKHFLSQTGKELAAMSYMAR